MWKLENVGNLYKHSLVDLPFMWEQISWDG